MQPVAWDIAQHLILTHNKKQLNPDLKAHKANNFKQKRKINLKITFKIKTHQDIWKHPKTASF